MARNASNLKLRLAPNERKIRESVRTPQHRHDGSWTLTHGSNRCVCTKCGDGFNSVAAFDKHQILNADGSVLCRNPESLGMVRIKDGWWVTALRPDGITFAQAELDL